MKTVLTLLTICTILGYNIAAQADNGLYVNGAVSMVEVDAVDANFETYSVGIGWKLSDNLAVEARYMETFDDEEVSVQGISVDYALDDIFSFYVKGILPMGKASLYALVGKTQAKATASATACNEYHCETFTASDRRTFTSVGLGASYSVSSDIEIGAEVIRLDDDVDQYSLTMNKSF